MSPSRLRQRINTLCQQLGQPIEVVLDRQPQFAASLYEHKIKCGKPQCKCAKSKAYRHHMWCVSFVDQGRSKTRVVPPEQRASVQDLTQAYRQSRDARRQIKQLMQQLGEDSLFPLKKGMDLWQDAKVLARHEGKPWARYDLPPSVRPRSAKWPTG